MSSQRPEQQPDQQAEKPDFHGAAIIDEHGQEIPITEEMVREACKQLEDSDPEKEQR